MTKKYSVDSIDVPEPCAEPWENMKGSTIKRFCNSCEKDVYNLSGMPRRRANLILRKSGGKICVRFAKDETGRVVTTERPLYQITRRAGIAAGVIATSMSLSALTYAQGGPVILRKHVSKAVVEKTISKSDAPIPSESDETSQISITVLDSTGAVIPGALVKLVKENTEQAISGYTGSNGVADFGALPKGRLKVSVEMDGFSTYSGFTRLALPIEPNLEIVLETGILTGVIVIDSYEIPVFEAIAQNRIDDFEAALRSGFDINIKASNKRTALHVAVDHLRVGIVEQLLKAGSDINAKTGDKESALVSLAEDFGEEDEDVIKILRLLVWYGADLDAQNESKETALIDAAYYDDPEAVEILLSAGADTTLKDEDGETAYQKIGDERIREIFHRYGIFQ